MSNEAPAAPVPGQPRFEPQPQPLALDASGCFCVTDVGSTTTKAFLFQRQDSNGGGWSFLHREAPTTVEKPHEDVTVGVRAALEALETASGRRLLAEGGRPGVPYLSTSSAGGGLAMVVTGLVREVTSRSAERVALGAGAILLDVIAMDDGRTPYEKIEALRRLRPDMVLLAGGFDGDALSGPVFLAELIREAGLRPKLTTAGKLPVVYAGNRHANGYVRDVLDERFHLHPVANIRPESHTENLEPARHAIHDLFMGHVMSQAPGYERLLSWVSAPVVPTPSAFGEILAIASRALGQRILAIDIGGATTDVFTAQDGEVSRTVSANLGMSYSILNVLQQTGPGPALEILRREFACEDMGEAELIDRVGNKHLYPTSLPRTEREARLEQAVGAVAIREAVREHLSILTGERLSRSKSELAFQNSFEVNLSRDAEPAPEARMPRLRGYDLIIGSGGILSHSPRDRAARMLIAALDPGGKVEVALDRAFMFPHLGVLAGVDEALALTLFEQLGLLRLGRVDALRREQRPLDPIGDALGEEAVAGENRETSERVSLEASYDQVRRGPHAERRELASPGEVFVEGGDQVTGDQLIARSTRTFRRPFFLPAGSALRAAPEEIEACLLKKIGDSIEPNELIGKRKLRFMRTREYRSPVAGTLERMLPDGTLVVREHPDHATERVAIRAATDLNIKAGELRAYLRVEVGQKVEREQTLASRGRPGVDLRVSRSPVRGKVADINLDFGVITVEPLREELDVRAWIPGEVREVTARGAVVSANALCLTGCWGRGGECSGALTLDSVTEGGLCVLGHATRSDLLQMIGHKVAGLIAGSVRLADVNEVDPGFTILLTEGFGEMPLSNPIRAELAGHAGATGYLDGRTELRVGVRRPRLVVPRGCAP